VFVVQSSCLSGTVATNSHSPLAAAPATTREELSDAVALKRELIQIAEDANKLEQPSSRHFKRSIAEAVAALSSITGCRNHSRILDWSCSRCKRYRNVVDFKPYKLLTDDAFDLFGIVGYLPSLDGIMLTFRGTDSRNIFSWITSLVVSRQTLVCAA
jgi:hypothetical protein